MKMIDKKILSIRDIEKMRGVIKWMVGLRHNNLMGSDGECARDVDLLCNMALQTLVDNEK